MLTVLDENTREARCVAVKPKMNSADVLDAPYPLLLQHGKPEYNRSDNGAEFVAAALQDWLRKVGIRPIQIYPASPWENGYNERFDGTLRREVLNAEWFHTTKQAPIVINTWARQYNRVRPHHAPNMRPPLPETVLKNRQSATGAPVARPFTQPREAGRPVRNTGEVIGMYSPKTVKTNSAPPRKLTKEERDLVETTLNIAAWTCEKRGATHVPVDRIDSPLMVAAVISVLQQSEHKVDPNVGSHAAA